MTEDFPAQLPVAASFEPAANETEWADGLAGETAVCLILCALANAVKRRKR